MDYWALKKKAIMGAAQVGKLTEETGYPLILENSKGEKLKDYRIWGNKKGKNYLDISKIVATPDSTASMFIANVDATTGTIALGFDTATLGSIYKAINKTLGVLAPELEVGKTYYLNGISSSDKHLFLLKSASYWDFGTARTITEDDLNSTIIIYGNTHYADEGVFKIEGLSITEEASTEYEPYQENDGLGAGGNIDVVASGKNLCAVNSIASVGWAIPMPEIKNSLNNLKAGTYTISFNISLVYKNEEKYMLSDFGGLLFVFSGKGQIYATKTWQTSEIGTSDKIRRTVTLAEEDVGTVTNVWAYGCGNMSTGGSGRADIFDIQIEEGAEVTSYEPFKEPITTTIDLTGYNSIMPNDYIDFRNQIIVRSDGSEEDIFLPKIPTVKGYNIITASDAELEASNMYGKYIKKG